MRLFRLLALMLIVAVPAAVRAEVEAGDIPGQADWYLHADLAAMRAVPSGHALYAWLNDEVFADVKQEIGIDIGAEVDSVTAFADEALGAVLLVEGPISQQTRDKLLALATLKAKLDTGSYDGKTWYHVQRGEHRKRGKRSLEAFDDSAWFTFEVEDKLIVTSTQEQLEALLDSGGRLAGTGSHAGSLFVLTADKEFVQAGARTAELADDDTDWNSNILRNTEKVALLVSDRDGLVAVEAQLVSKDPTITRSLGGIINGLVSLQAFNEDIDPAVRTIIQNTKIEVLDNVLSIDMVFDPAIVVRVLDERHAGTQ
ncbi:MAG TPA: hypothetical protein VFG91_10085 [Woeseiaceae bacterium]|nr:hypothetical protein [Woeseiaceae bacterium]